MLKSNIAILWTPIFEWYVVRCGSKNGCQKCMCLKGTRLHSQNMLSMLGSIINIIGRTYMTIKRACRFSLWQWKRYSSHELQKLWRTRLWPQSRFANYLALNRVNHTQREVGAERKSIWITTHVYLTKKTQEDSNFLFPLGEWRDVLPGLLSGDGRNCTREQQHQTTSWRNLEIWSKPSCGIYN